MFKKVEAMLPIWKNCLTCVLAFLALPAALRSGNGNVSS